MAVFSGNGSNTAPSFTFSSDTDTGIYRPADGQIAITNNGSVRLFVSQNGDVAINNGTTALRKFSISADNTFDANNGGQFGIFGQSDVNKKLLFGFDTSSNYGWIQSTQSGSSTKLLALNPAGGRIGLGAAVAGFGGGVDIDTIAVVNPLVVNVQSSEKMAVQSNGAVRVGVNAAPSGSGTGSLAIGGPLTIEASSSTYGSYAVYSEQVTDGSISASTGTIQFDFQSVNAAVYLSCLVKVSVALRTNNTPGSTQPQCVYYFGLFRTNAGVVSVMSPTTVYENAFVRASHFAVSNPSTNIGRLTLTNPTASAQGGVYHVELMSYGGLWQLQSVTTT